MARKHERSRLTRAEAQPVVDEVCGVLDTLRVDYRLGGSWRRGTPTVGDLDVLVLGEPLDAFDVGMSYTRRGPSTASGDFVTQQGLLQVDLWSVLEPEKQLGAFMWFVTGPMDLNVAMRAHALRRGLTLSQYGVFRDDNNQQVDDGTEEGVASALKWPWLEPELRDEWRKHARR